MSFSIFLCFTSTSATKHFLLQQIVSVYLSQRSTFGTKKSSKTLRSLCQWPTTQTELQSALPQYSLGLQSFRYVMCWNMWTSELKKVIIPKLVLFEDDHCSIYIFFFCNYFFLYIFVRNQYVCESHLLIKTQRHFRPNRTKKNSI